MFKKFCLTILLVFSLSACHLFDHSDEKVVITVGKTSIAENEIRRDIVRIISEMGMTDKESKAAIKSIISKVIEKYLIMEYGKEEGITVLDDEWKAALNNIKKDYPEDVFNKLLLQRYIDPNRWEEDLRENLLIKKIISTAVEDIPPITFNEIMEYYESHINEFMQPQMVQLRQIVTRSREEAEKILDRLAEGDEMGKLAKEYSITPEAKNEGIMGWITKGELEENIEEVVFSLPVGGKSPILESSYGYHIFEVLSVSDEGFLDLPEAKAYIESMLILQKRESLYVRWIEGLKDRFTVTIDEEIYTDWNMEG